LPRDRDIYIYGDDGPGVRFGHILAERIERLGYSAQVCETGPDGMRVQGFYYWWDTNVYDVSERENPNFFEGWKEIKRDE